VVFSASLHTVCTLYTHVEAVVALAAVCGMYSVVSGDCYEARQDITLTQIHSVILELAETARHDHTRGRWVQNDRTTAMRVEHVHPFPGRAMPNTVAIYARLVVTLLAYVKPVLVVFIESVWHMAVEAACFDWFRQHTYPQPSEVSIQLSSALLGVRLLTVESPNSNSLETVVTESGKTVKLRHIHITRHRPYVGSHEKMFLAEVYEFDELLDLGKPLLSGFSLCRRLRPGENISGHLKLQVRFDSHGPLDRYLDENLLMGGQRPVPHNRGGLVQSLFGVLRTTHRLDNRSKEVHMVHQVLSLMHRRWP